MALWALEMFGHGVILSDADPICSVNVALDFQENDFLESAVQQPCT